MEAIQWQAVQGLQFIVEGIEPPPPNAPSMEQYHVLLHCASERRRARMAWIAGPSESPLQVQDVLVVACWDRSALFVDRVSDGTRHSLLTPRHVVNA
jgi:hypothetical protein